MTATKLLELLREAGCEPAAVAGELGPELEYLDAPAAMERVVPLLRTGVVAILTGRGWFGLRADGHAFELNPRDTLPPWVTYLTTGRRPGDPGPGVWDRVPRRARESLPGCFAPDVVPEPARRRHRQADLSPTLTSITPEACR